ncbi:MAG: DNA repair protein RecN, partial [Acidobacteria bacterium]|nr:DNA repair protein RecN [Acidobacteriota bacterium]
MLIDLHVRNLAVVAEASVEFAPGLNVLTGETGAGKSIVVDALALLRGARASSELVRSGADRLVVSGRFDLDAALARALAEVGLDVEDELVVRREIEREGRNRAFINDQPVTLKLLKQATEPILQIHAQREELGLATPKAQLGFVDAVGGSKAESLLRSTAAAYETYTSLAARLEGVRGDRRLHDERVDLLRFQLSEIDAANLRAGEDGELFAERDRLRNSEEIAAALGHGHLRLVEEDDAIVARLARLETELRAIATWEPEAETWGDELRDARIGLSELADTLRRRLDGVSADPRRLDGVEERLAAIDRLCRKYGDSVSQVLAYGAAGEEELKQLEEDMQDSAALEADVAAALASYAEVARKLSAGRKRWARSLVESAESQFADLALQRARLSVELGRESLGQSPLVIDGQSLQFGARGFDRVELYLAANPGEEARPLATSASGGELSRIYLALRLAVQQPGQIATTMVFDEADAGLGGEAASALGRKLQRLGRGSQILAVTHLPQVASFSDRHFGVRKSVSGGRTRTTLERLGSSERIDEVARMLAGDQRTEV